MTTDRRNSIENSLGHDLLVAVVVAVAGAVAAAVIAYWLTRPAASNQLFREEASPDVSFISDLPAGATFYLSASAFDQGQGCSNGTNLCVLFEQETAARSIQIGGLIPGHGFAGPWVGRSVPDELQDKEPSYCGPRNCDGGCQFVDAYLLKDGQLESIWRLARPPTL